MTKYGNVFPLHREAFFKDLKWQIKSGQIDVPDSKKSEMGAYIAQVDFGDRIVTPVQSLCVNYPAYFPNWNGGLAHIIAKEHNKLRGKLLLNIEGLVAWPICIRNSMTTEATLHVEMFANLRVNFWIVSRSAS